MLRQIIISVHFSTRYGTFCLICAAVVESSSPVYVENFTLDSKLLLKR